MYTHVIAKKNKSILPLKMASKNALKKRGYQSEKSNLKDKEIKKSTKQKKCRMICLIVPISFIYLHV